MTERHRNFLESMRNVEQSVNLALRELYKYPYAEKFRVDLSSHMLEIDSIIEDITQKWTHDEGVNMDERMIREILEIPVMDMKEFLTEPLPVGAAFDTHLNAFLYRSVEDGQSHPFQPSKDLTDAWVIAEYVNTFCNYYNGKLRVNKREDTQAKNWSPDNHAGKYVAEWGEESDSTTCYRGFGDTPAYAICDAALYWAQYGKNEIR